MCEPLRKVRSKVPGLSTSRPAQATRGGALRWNRLLLPILRERYPELHCERAFLDFREIHFCRCACYSKQLLMSVRYQSRSGGGVVVGGVVGAAGWVVVAAAPAPPCP